MLNDVRSFPAYDADKLYNFPDRVHNKEGYGKLRTFAMYSTPVASNFLIIMEISLGRMDWMVWYFKTFDDVKASGSSWTRLMFLNDSPLCLVWFDVLYIGAT